MQSERMRILTMLHEGRLTPEQADQLLQALGAGEQTQPAHAPAPRRSGWSFPDVAGTDIGDMVDSALSAAFGPSTKANYAPYKLTERRLSRWPDGITYTNFAVLTVTPDVPEELLRRKVARFVNFGQVIAPQPLLDALEDVCDQNFGCFQTPEEAVEPGPQAAA